MFIECTHTPSLAHASLQRNSPGTSEEFISRSMFIECTQRPTAGRATISAVMYNEGGGLPSTGNLMAAAAGYGSVRSTEDCYAALLKIPEKDVRLSDGLSILCGNLECSLLFTQFF